MTPVLVSVIIPTYNYGRFIGEAIASVLDQGVGDLEIIVIDDASTDNTQEVLASLKERRITVLSICEHFGGPGVVRNEGLNHARGQFITFLDADDRWCKNKLNHQLTIMESEPEVGAIFTNFVRFNDAGVFPQSQFEFMPELLTIPSVPTHCGLARRVTGNAFESFISMSQFPTFVQTTMFRANIIRDLRFPVINRATDDLDFCMRAYQKTSVSYISEPMVEVRRHGTNMSWDLMKLEHEVRETLCDLESRIDLVNPKHLSSLRRRIGRAWIDSGRLYLSQGCPRPAAYCFLKGFGYAKSRFSALKHLLVLPYLWQRAR